MKIAIDIDGTLCWSNLPVFLEECNTTFDLRIDHVTLASLTSKHAFYALPQVANKISQQDYFQDDLDWIEYRERCITESLLMDDAVTGVAKLAQLGELAYYTARYCSEPDIQQEIETFTRQWLDHHTFVNPQDIIFCNQIPGKIQELLKLAEKETIILVDDSFKSVVRYIEQLQQSEYNLLLEKLIFVAARALPEDLPSTSLCIIALSSWHEIDHVIERIQYNARQTTNAAPSTTSRDAEAAKAWRSRYGKTTPRQNQTQVTDRQC